MHASRWTPELLASAEAMWREGKTSNQIANDLRVTRGAVMGQASRRDWYRPPVVNRNNRGRPGQQRAARIGEVARIGDQALLAKIARRSEQRVSGLRSAKASTFKAPPSGGIPITALRDDTCRWPLWTDDAQCGNYCGQEILRIMRGMVMQEHVYCARHAKKAYHNFKGE